MKILLLEDDTFICNQVKDYFELDGNKIDFFNDGEALLDNAVLENYDIFLLDINTPKKKWVGHTQRDSLSKHTNPSHIFNRAK